MSHEPIEDPRIAAGPPEPTRRDHMYHMEAASQIIRKHAAGFAMCGLHLDIVGDPTLWTQYERTMDSFDCLLGGLELRMDSREPV